MVLYAFGAMILGLVMIFAQVKLFNIHDELVEIRKIMEDLVRLTRKNR